MKRFELGQTVVTVRIWDAMEAVHGFSEFIKSSLMRYISNDWGDLCDEDKALNDDGLKDGDDAGRLLAAYNLPESIRFDGEDKIWIITEWDRSVTTVLFPSDY